MTYSKLLAGFAEFHKKFFSDKENELFDSLVAEGQKPSTLVIACSDSRIDPAIITQSDPGDIFVVRNVAAIVPPYEPDLHYHGTSAAIEYAVKVLNVENIIILGHSHCGGVNALNQCCSCCGSHDELNDFDFVLPWVQIGREAKSTLERYCNHLSSDKKSALLEQAMVIQSLQNLLAFPWIKERCQNNTISLYGWYFDMENGALLSYDNNQTKFINVAGIIQHSQEQKCQTTDMDISRFLKNAV